MWVVISGRVLLEAESKQVGSPPPPPISAHAVREGGREGGREGASERASE
eukprot:SAG11_NODE_5676_length_1489_cov_1.266187_1_plen_49_part_10